MQSSKLMLSGLTLVVCLLTAASMALASKKETPDNCAAVGAVAVRCYECTAGQEAYKGKAAVMAQYEEAQGKKFCVAAQPAKEACKRTYGIQHVGFYAKFKLGIDNKEEFYNTQCVKNVGY